VEDSDELVKELPLITFDAVEQFYGFSPLETTQFVYNNYGDKTSGLAKMDPG